MQRLYFEDLGKCDYEKALAIQEKHFNSLIDRKTQNKPIDQNQSAGHLLFCEHEPVYTIGKNGSEDNLISTKAFEQVAVHRTSRGGDITYHGPGQLVGYPILDLEQLSIGLASYVYNVEEAIIQTLGSYGVRADRTKEAPGVWLDYDTPHKARKICALGIRSSRWVTMHGFAFNVNTDLNYFGGIIPCGISDKAVTSLEKELGKTMNMEEVKGRLKSCFERIFDIKFV